MSTVLGGRGGCHRFQGTHALQVAAPRAFRLPKNKTRVFRRGPAVSRFVSHPFHPNHVSDGRLAEIARQRGPTRADVEQSAASCIW